MIRNNPLLIDDEARAAHNRALVEATKQRKKAEYLGLDKLPLEKWEEVPYIYKTSQVDSVRRASCGWLSR